MDKPNYEAFIREIAILAGAGACCMKSINKHQYLMDISRKCEQAGFDVLGDPITPNSTGDGDG